MSYAGQILAWLTLGAILGATLRPLLRRDADNGGQP